MTIGAPVGTVTTWSFDATPVPRDAWVHGEHSVGAVFVGEPTAVTR